MNRLDLNGNDSTLIVPVVEDAGRAGSVGDDALEYPVRLTPGDKIKPDDEG